MQTWKLNYYMRLAKKQNYSSSAFYLSNHFALIKP